MARGQASQPKRAWGPLKRAMLTTPSSIDHESREAIKQLEGAMAGIQQTLLMMTQQMTELSSKMSAGGSADLCDGSSPCITYGGEANLLVEVLSCGTQRRSRPRSLNCRLC